MTKRPKITTAVTIAVATIIVVIVGASMYMLDYSLDHPMPMRKTSSQWTQRIESECPWTKPWIDSVYTNHCVKDTFVTMPSGYKGHAMYLHAPHPTNKTAVIVHGYKVRAEGMLHIAFLYNHDLGYNVLLPDLYGHGKSEGDHIQMGWNDRWDVMRWSEIANDIFAPKTLAPHTKDKTSHTSQPKSTEQVLHGISMGAATVMSVSGEQTPSYVRCFVEDCGFSSVWDEFKTQLHDQFGMPPFPLMNTTSMICRAKYGWSFDEASPLRQVGKSTKPMLFIHGDNDDFVPYTMLRPLYAAKTKGRKAIFVAKGSAHAMAYSDHRKEYTEAVKKFISKQK